MYSRITGQIVAALEAGARLGQAVERETCSRAHQPPAPPRRPAPYRGVLSHWASAIEQKFEAPLWMTYHQATELGAHVRKDEKGSPVYANSVTRSETDPATGDDIAREIYFFKGYTLFSVEQIDGLPAQYTERASPRLKPAARISRAESFFAATRPSFPTEQPRLLPPLRRHHRRSALRKLPRRRKLLRHARPRDHALDLASVPPRPRLRKQALRL